MKRLLGEPRGVPWRARAPAHTGRHRVRFLCRAPGHGRAPQQFVGRIAQHLGRCLVDEGATTLVVQSEDALIRRLQQEMILRLSRRRAQVFSLGKPPFLPQPCLHPNEQIEDRRDNGGSRRRDLEIKTLNRLHQRRCRDAHQHCPLERIGPSHRLVRLYPVITGMCRRRCISSIYPDGPWRATSSERSVRVERLERPL